MALQYSSDPDNSSMNADQATHYLTSLPYLQRRKKLLLPPNNYPRFFYKYLGPLVEDKKLRDLFIDSRLHLQSPANFNDPFDMKGNIVNELDRRKREKGLNKLFKQIIPALERSERRTKVRNAARDPQTFQQLKESLEGVIERYGISCFTIDPCSILMWSHYGQKHTGIVLQFEHARDILTFSHVLPVDYQKEYPTINYYDSDPQKNVAYILRKFEDWGYEREYRFIKADSADTFWKFNASALRGVILGCRTSAQEEERLRALIKERKKRDLGIIKIYKAEQHKTDYKIIIRRAQLN